MRYISWALAATLAATLAALPGCTKVGTSSSGIRLPRAGEHLTLEEVLGCKAADVEIVVDEWTEVSRKALPGSEAAGRVRREFPTYITLAETEHETLMRNVSLRTFDGKGTMRCPMGNLAKWTQFSEFLYVHIENSNEKVHLTLKLAPREWLKILDEVKKR